MQFFDPRSTLVHSPINRRGNGQSTSNHRADTRQETGKSLRSLFSVDHFHWRYVVAEKDAWNATPDTPVLARSKWWAKKGGGDLTSRAVSPYALPENHSRHSDFSYD